MSTTVDKLNYLNDTKSAIREAIENRGVSVLNSDTFRSYAEKIESISSETSTCKVVDTFTGINNNAAALMPILATMFIEKLDLSKMVFNRRSQCIATNMFAQFRNLTDLKFPPQDFTLGLKGSYDDTDTCINMFLMCKNLTNVTWSNNWSIGVNCSDCPLSHNTVIDLFNKLIDISSGTNLTLQFSSTTKSYMSEEEIAIATDKGWTIA